MSELFITKSEKVKAEIKGLVQELTERYPAYKGGHKCLVWSIIP